MPPAITPSIRTTVVGSYPVPDWLAALPSQQALVDATRVVFKTQEMAGIDVVADGELYRFDVNHPDTNGMIDYFVRPLAAELLDVGPADLRPHPGHRADEVLDHPVRVRVVDVEPVQLPVGHHVDPGHLLGLEHDACGVDQRLLARQGGEPVGDGVGADDGRADGWGRHAGLL